jgi:hypothetical protein
MLSAYQTLLLLQELLLLELMHKKKWIKSSISWSMLVSWCFNHSKLSAHTHHSTCWETHTHTQLQTCIITQQWQWAYHFTQIKNTGIKTSHLIQVKTHTLTHACITLQQSLWATPCSCTHTHITHSLAVWPWAYALFMHKQYAITMSTISIFTAFTYTHARVLTHSIKSSAQWDKLLSTKFGCPWQQSGKALHQPCL